jgi:hypothetical protein
VIINPSPSVNTNKLKRGFNSKARMKTKAGGTHGKTH